MKLMSFAWVAGLAMAAGGAAHAAVVTATDVILANPGAVTALADPARYVATNALGVADESFYSLGLAGDAMFGFGQSFSGKTQITIKEITFGSLSNIESYGEAVDVYAVSGGGETLIGRLTNFQAYSGVSLIFDGNFDSLKFVDVTGDEFGASPSFDGFDIDSVELVSLLSVPLPASGVILLGGLAYLALRRRKS